MRDSNLFATFEGKLAPDRVRHLFAHRSFADRALMFVVWTSITAVLFAFAWFLSGRGGFPVTVRWMMSVGIAGWMFAFGLVQQFAGWHKRRWFQWNGLLAGRYRAELTDQHVDIATDRFALRFSYALLSMTDHGLLGVRLGFDATACRAILLNVEDVTPPRSAREVHAYVKQGKREAKRRLVELQHVSDRDLPLPLLFNDHSARVTFNGPQRQAEFVATLEAANPETKHDRIRNRVYAVMAVAFVGLVILLAVGSAVGEQFGFEIWTQAVFFGVFLLFVAMTLLLKRRAKAAIQADPDAEAGHLDGWVSSDGVAAYYRHGYTAIAWSGCDAIETSEGQILLKFWKGDFLLLARHMFADDADFEQAKLWATAGSAAC